MLTTPLAMAQGDAPDSAVQASAPQSGGASGFAKMVSENPALTIGIGAAIAVAIGVAVSGGSSSSSGTN
ncbi:hypothetical protein [Halomonas halodenitrificans]|uniref:hypothetical protein n=1 Tax=Halomonas halodenitrificans TaxID=28252 RepID=UPI0004831FEE|nr:hypothetical protein [Halomonas halodenitrificans]